MKQNPKNLVRIFNAFAKKAVKDFPQLKGKFLIYSWPTKTCHGAYRSNKLQKNRLILQAEAQGSDTIACANRDGKCYTIAYFDPKTRLMTAAGERRTREIRNILEHELAHLVAPCGFDDRHGANFRECVADAYSFIRQIQQRRDITRSLDSAIWKQTKNFLLDKVRSHYTSPVLIALKGLAQRQDLSKLSPSEAANLAYRLARQYACKTTQLGAIAKAFAPLRKIYGKKEDVSLQTCLRVALKKHGKHSDVIFQAGYALLRPYLNEQIEVLATEMTQKAAKHQRQSGPYWTKARKKIAKRIGQITEKPILRQLDDMQLLGKFDPQKPGLIDPEQYESKWNQKRLQKNRLASVGL